MNVFFHVYLKELKCYECLSPKTARQWDNEQIESCLAAISRPRSFNRNTWKQAKVFMHLNVPRYFLTFIWHHLLRFKNEQRDCSSNLFFVKNYCCLSMFKLKKQIYCDSRYIWSVNKSFCLFSWPCMSLSPSSLVDRLIYTEITQRPDRIKYCCLKSVEYFCFSYNIWLHILFTPKSPLWSTFVNLLEKNESGNIFCFYMWRNKVHPYSNKYKRVSNFMYSCKRFLSITHLIFSIYTWYVHVSRVIGS